jgi:hypothetical protein
LEYPGVDERIITKRPLKKEDIMMGTEFICLMIGTRGRPLVNTVMNLGIPWQT